MDFTLISKMPTNSNLEFLIPFFALHLAPLWVGIFNILRLLLSHHNTFYAVTNKRVMMRGGFFGIDFTAIDYDKITDIQVTVNPLENILGVGTLRFNSGKLSINNKPTTDNFVAIEDPYAVFKQVKTVSVDVKTDWSYPNKQRPDENPGYRTTYNPTR